MKRPGAFCRPSLPRLPACPALSGAAAAAPRTAPFAAFSPTVESSITMHSSAVTLRSPSPGRARAIDSGATAGGASVQATTRNKGGTTAARWHGGTHDCGTPDCGTVARWHAGTTAARLARAHACVRGLAPGWARCPLAACARHEPGPHGAPGRKTRNPGPALPQRGTHADSAGTRARSATPRGRAPGARRRPGRWSGPASAWPRRCQRGTGPAPERSAVSASLPAATLLLAGGAASWGGGAAGEGGLQNAPRIGPSPAGKTP